MHLINKPPSSINQKEIIMRNLLLKSAVAVALALPVVAQAESQFNTAAGPSSAVARVDFQITIPRVLFLQVGTGTSMATNAAIDMVTFTVPAANVGDSTVIAGAGGNLGTGKVTAKLIGNAGAIVFSSTVPNGLSDGAGSTISYSQIATASVVGGTGNLLTPPALVDGATTNSAGNGVTSGTKVTSRDATWTYTYLNSVTPAAGTYGGAGVNQGRVTYTATMP